MLYLDSSALAKRYFNEKGSDAVASRFESGEKIFTSTLSYAEIHSVIARKFRNREYDRKELSRLNEEFKNDWLFSLSTLELDLSRMTALPQLLENFALRASDAIHLSTAIWLKDYVRLAGRFGDRGGAAVEFGVADKRLAEAAAYYDMEVFNPNK